MSQGQKPYCRMLCSTSPAIPGHVGIHDILCLCRHMCQMSCRTVHMNTRILTDTCHLSLHLPGWIEAICNICIDKPLYNIRRCSDGRVRFDYIDSNASTSVPIRADARISADTMLEVCMPDGRHIATCTRRELQALPHGLYIIRIGSQSHKVYL